MYLDGTYNEKRDILFMAYIPSYTTTITTFIRDRNWNFVSPCITIAFNENVYSAGGKTVAKNIKQNNSNKKRDPGSILLIILLEYSFKW